MLPRRPEDSGDVTFIISSTAPPRTSLLFVKLPSGIGEKTRPARTHGWTSRRAHLGELVYSTSRSSASESQSGTKRYEAGQILEFDDETDAAAVDVAVVGQLTEIRHDTNLLDYDALGITGDSLTGLLAESDAALRSLSADLNGAIQSRLDAESGLAVNQHLITETNKAIAAVNVVIAISPSQGLIDVLDSLSAKLAAALSERDALASAANAAAAEAVAIRDKILAVSQLVR